jgi:hypothetical protein
MAAHPLLQFWTVPLHPPQYGGMVSLQATFLKQFFDISQGKRVSKVPANGTENQLDYRLGCHRVLFNLPTVAQTKVATQLPFANSAERFAVKSAQLAFIRK